MNCIFNPSQLSLLMFDLLRHYNIKILVNHFTRQMRQLTTYIYLLIYLYYFNSA